MEERSRHSNEYKAETLKIEVEGPSQMSVTQ
jgi:hypothetical protein